MTGNPNPSPENRIPASAPPDRPYHDRPQGFRPYQDQAEFLATMSGGELADFIRGAIDAAISLQNKSPAQDFQAGDRVLVEMEFVREWMEGFYLVTPIDGNGGNMAPHRTLGVKRGRVLAPVQAPPESQAGEWRVVQGNPNLGGEWLVIERRTSGGGERVEGVIYSTEALPPPQAPPESQE